MRKEILKPANGAVIAMMALSLACPAVHAAPGGKKDQQRILRPGAISRPGALKDLPAAPHLTLKVKEFSGDFARWVDHMTINEAGRLTFSWKNIRGPLASARWQIARSASAPVRDRFGHIGEGPLPRIPAKGASVMFNIDMKRFLPATPPPSPRRYYVRVVVSEADKPAYIDSRPVVLTYQRPSQQITQFTEEGLSTTPKKKVAPPGDRRYSYPKVMGLPLDWCKRWASQCGQPAADEFCRREGYRRAKSFSKTSATTAGVCEKGMCKTRVINTYQVCHHPSCRAFFHIVCTHDRDCTTKSQVVATKMERCDEKSLKIASKNGLVDIPLQGKYLMSFNGIPVTAKFNWYCGGSRETTECPGGATEIDVTRYGVITDYMAEDRVEMKCRKVYQVCKD